MFSCDMIDTLNGLVETARNELPMHLKGVTAAPRKKGSWGKKKRKYTNKRKAA